jgi:ribonuclease P protein component
MPHVGDLVQTSAAEAATTLGQRPASLPRHRKLLKPFEFSAVLKDGKRYPGKFIVLVVRQFPGRLARLGLAIAKKHAKLARDRNQIKRIARESFRALRLAMPPVEIVVLTRSREKKAVAPDQHLLRSEFDLLFSKLISAPKATFTPRSALTTRIETPPNE